MYVNYESVGFLFHRFWSHSVNIETGVFCFYAFDYSTRTHDQFTVRRSSTITYRVNMTVNVKFLFSFVLLVHQLATRVKMCCRKCLSFHDASG